MVDTGALKITTNGEREIVMSRVFDAPRTLVFQAFTRPELIKRWLLGPPGWEMIVCEVDLKVGGKYRYLWRKQSTGVEMGMGGVYRELITNQRIVSTEKFDEAWYSGEAIGTALFVEQNGKTTLTQTMLYDSRETRDGILKSGMEHGVAASYDRLDEILASQR